MSAIDTFFDAWGESDATTRAKMISEAVEEDVIYADPRSPDPMHGIDALSAYVGMFSANAPGWTARVVSSDTTATVTRATVAFGGKGPDGSDMVQHGQYFIEGGDKLARIIGFVGTGAPE